MTMHAWIGKQKDNGRIEAIYVHFNGHAGTMQRILPQLSHGDLTDLMQKGDVVSLLTERGDLAQVQDMKPTDDSHRKSSIFNSTNEFIRNGYATGGCGFIYLAGDKEGVDIPTWYYLEMQRGTVPVQRSTTFSLLAGWKPTPAEPSAIPQRKLPTACDAWGQMLVALRGAGMVPETEESGRAALRAILDYTDACVRAAVREQKD